MGLTLYEQETIINMNREDDEMLVYTADPALMRRLSKLAAYKKVKEYRNGGKVIAMDFTADKKLLFLRGKVLKMELSEEEKMKRAEKLKAARSAKTHDGVLEK